MCNTYEGWMFIFALFQTLDNPFSHDIPHTGSWRSARFFVNAEGRTVGETNKQYYLQTFLSFSTAFDKHIIFMFILFQSYMSF